MINPNWSVVDLDPRTWRALGRFFDPGQFIRAAQPGEHGLFILHDNGPVLRIVDSQHGIQTNLDITYVNYPGELAQELYAQAKWQRVHIINKQHLAKVARQAQNLPDDARRLDNYYHLVYNLLWGSDSGYVAVPPHPGHWHGWTYQNIQDFVQQLPETTTLALGVFAENLLEIGLILEFSQHAITRVTTFEALPSPENVSGVNLTALEQLWEQLTAGYAAPAGVLLCHHDVFTRWIETPVEKYSFLQDARQRGQAIWRLKL